MPLQDLTYQILTKRPNSSPIGSRLSGGKGDLNVWPGVSVENERFLTRMDTVRKIPAVVRFIH